MQTFPCIVWLQKAAKSLGRREGAATGFFSPPSLRRQEPQSTHVGLGRSCQAQGDTEERGADRIGGSAGQGWGGRWIDL